MYGKAMRFKEGAQLDPSQVEDQRGQGGGFSRGGGLGSPVVIGGGGGGLLLVLLYVAIQVLGGGQVLAPTSQPQVNPYSDREVAGSQVAQSCRTGADANARTDCRIVGVVNSVQQYWSTELPRRGVPTLGSEEDSCLAADREIERPFRRVLGPVG